MNEKPGYWAVLPSQVRYDHSIPPNAKLLYAEISSLTDLSGYCFASNAYFEQLYELSERTVIRLIRSLEAAGYIRVEANEGGKEKRRIYAGINPLQAPLTKMSVPPDKNVTPIINKKITSNPPKAPRGDCEWEPALFERFWRAYPRKRDKASAKREWDKLKPDRKLMQIMSAALDRDKASDEWQRGIGIPYACRWLSHHRWEDGEDADLAGDAADAAPEQRLAGARC